MSNEELRAKSDLEQRRERRHRGVGWARHDEACAAAALRGHRANSDEAVNFEYDLIGDLGIRRDSAIETGRIASTKKPLI